MNTFRITHIMQMQKASFVSTAVLLNVWNPVGNKPVRIWRQQHFSFGSHRPKSTSEHARTSIIIIPVYNTDLVTIWTWSYWHSDTVVGCQRYPGYRDTWVHTEADKISLRAPSCSGYFKNKRLNWQNVLFCFLSKLGEKNASMKKECHY